MDKIRRTTNELIFLNGYASGMLAERNGKEFNHDEALKEFYGKARPNHELIREEDSEEDEEEYKSTSWELDTSKMTPEEISKLPKCRYKEVDEDIINLNRGER